MSTLIIFLALAFMLVANNLSAAEISDKKLFGMVVVIDPGHGGKDPGSHGKFKDAKGYELEVVEDEYVYDVSRRLYRQARAFGGVAFMTARDELQTKPIDLLPDKVIPRDDREVYALNGEVVGARTKGIRPRITYANRIFIKYPKHRIVFISIHFDSTPNENLTGVHMIAPEKGRADLSDSLAREFRKAGRLRSLNGAEYNPAVIDGDRNHGQRRIFVLREENEIPQRVLIELGNFSNPTDVWRIRNFEVREQYAKIIAASLASLNKFPLARFH